jgi:hypothetical protein
LPAGRERTVTVALTRAGRRALARRGRLRVGVNVTLAGTARPLASRSVTLRR